jgi:hypothetical protein
MSMIIAPANADSLMFQYNNGIETHYHPAPEVIHDNVGYLRGDLPNGLFIVQPLQINIELEEDQSYVISDDIFLVYGNGGDLSSAIADYLLSLTEYYQIVEHNANLNQFDNKQFTFLKTYVQPK